MFKNIYAKDYSDPVKFTAALQSKPEEFWLRRGQNNALSLFHQMAQRVPAYKKFLKAHQIEASAIRTIEDFKKVPTTDKNNYLRKYPLEELCWDGSFSETPWVFSSTSGTSGEPFYFPRTDVQDLQYALTAEVYLRENFNIQKKNTLYLDCFAMGAWIGGLFTYQAIKHLAVRGGYKLSIFTPGVNKKEILRAIVKLAPKYDQVIIGGYAPFVKEIIDEGAEQGIDWKKCHLKFIFSAEGFSEKFRDYVLDKAGCKDIYADSLNHYGIADLGTVAHETPISIWLRRAALKNTALNNLIFKHEHRSPTFAQYLPEMFFFEESPQGLVCSADSGLPLLRYETKDFGGVHSYSDIKNIFATSKIKIPDKISGRKKMNLPFVYVHERVDNVVSWYGANVYPEHIREAYHSKSLEPHLTGKFTLRVNYNRKLEPVLEIYSEVKNNHKPNKVLGIKLKKEVLKVLLQKNSEFRNSYQALPVSKREPKVVLKNFGAAPYFLAGGKQKWVLK